MKNYLYIILLFMSSVLFAQQNHDNLSSQERIPLRLMVTNPGIMDSIKNVYTFHASEAKNETASPFKAVPAKKESFLKSDWMYFIGTAALAAVVYFLLPEDKDNTKKTYTFGTPSTPR